VNRLLHLVLFLASLLATSTGLRELEVLPFWGWTSHRLDSMRTESEGIDTVFLGTSRMAYAAIPQDFDSASAELGRPTRSFSIALSGTRMLDSVRLVEWLVACKPRDLKRAIIEVHATWQELRETQWMTDQEIAMHDPCVFGERMRSIWVTKGSLWTKAVEAGYCVAHTLVSQLRIGQGVRLLEDKMDVAKGRRLRRTYPVNRQGWDAVEDVGLDHMAREHEQFLSQPEKSVPFLLERLRNPIPEWMPGGFDAESVIAMGRKLRAAGIEPVFVVMPAVSLDFQGRSEAQALRKEFRLLEFDRLVEHRPLWDRGNFYDGAHLCTEGARVFSRYLAEVLVECEGLPLDRDPKPRRLPQAAMRLTAKRVEGSGGIDLLADELPFVGEAVVIASHRRGQGRLPGGVALGVPWPPDFHATLQRGAVYEARCLVDWTGVDPTRPLYLQLGILDGPTVVGVSAVVELPPRR
jgi:hypothetical protein